MLGVKLSDYTKGEISKNRKGKGIGNKNSLGVKCSKENIEKSRLKLMGNKYSLGLKGELFHNWRGGTTDKNR